MRTRMSAAEPMLAALPAHAVSSVAKRESLSLLGVGAVGLSIALRRKG
jgi:hypothetical protein